jgi:hypothetical protein
MKKQSRGILFLWILIAAVAAGGTFLVAKHLGVGGGAGVAIAPTSASAGQPDADVQQDVSADAADSAAAVAMQNFSNTDDGYSFSVPASWNIERTGADTVAVHTDASSPDAACKIEVSAFPYSAGADGMADWIAHRIGADPSLAVVERSSEDVSFASGGGVKWVGTIDGISTTLVYAFNDRHAYEIAPSVIGVGADGSAPCDDMLGAFLSTLKI